MVSFPFGEVVISPCQKLPPGGCNHREASVVLLIQIVSRILLLESTRRIDGGNNRLRRLLDHDLGRSEGLHFWFAVVHCGSPWLRYSVLHTGRKLEPVATTH